MTTQYTFHEVANIFPMMSDDEFSALSLDYCPPEPDGEALDALNGYLAAPF